MGFDTYLKIDGHILLMWRKHASVLPRLLFRHNQLVVQAQSGNESPLISVTYEATAEEVLQNLDEIGLGWHAACVAYSEIRINGTVEGMVIGKGLSRGETQEQVNERVRAFEALPPETDLYALGAALAYQWGTSSEDGDITIFKEITYDGDIESVSKVGFDVYRVATNLAPINAFAAARAAESWAALYREAPLLAWPMLMCVFLRSLPTKTKVVLDLSEDAYESAGVASEDDAREYADGYWSGSAEGLSNVAQTYGRLFGVLASFDNKLGKQFWFARATDIYGRLVGLASAEGEVPMKLRGDTLEQLVEALIRTEEPELRVVEKNFRTRTEEIDILLANGLNDPFWIALGSPLVMVECKNWKVKPGVQELRILESKMRDRGSLCKIGIFVSISGFAQTILERLKTLQTDVGIIFLVDGEDLRNLVASRTRLTEWLRGPGLRRSLGR